MKKVAVIVGIIMFAALGLGATGAEAADRPTFEMGPVVSYFKYEEPGLMEDTGMLYGIYAKFRTPLKSGFLFGLDGQVTYGQVDYTSNATGTMDNIDDYMVELRGLFGYDYPVLDATTLTPYIGLGYRLLDDNSGGKRSTTGHWGYDRESHYIYVPIGLETTTALNDKWSAGAGVEFDAFLFGRQYSHLEDVSSSYDTLNNDQESGYGLKGKIKVIRKAESWNFVFEPYVQYWDIDESTTNASCGSICVAGYEPKNESMEYGVRLGAEF